VKDVWDVNIEYINCFLLTRGPVRIEGSALAAVIYDPFMRQYDGYYAPTCIEASPAYLSEILWNWDGKSDMSTLAVSKLQVV
jgi:hypothetical protein